MEVESSIDITSLQTNEVPPMHQAERDIDTRHDNESRMETEADIIQNKECIPSETNQISEEHNQITYGSEESCTALETKLKEGVLADNDCLEKDKSTDDQLDKESLTMRLSESEKTTKSPESKRAHSDSTESKIQPKGGQGMNDKVIRDHFGEEFFVSTDPHTSGFQNFKDDKPRNEDLNSSFVDKKVFTVRRLGDVDENGKFKLSNKELTKDELAQRYRSIIYMLEGNEDVVCTICLEEESYEDDQIVICDLCNSSFHQICYGGDLLSINEADDSEYIPCFVFLTAEIDEWFCARCTYLLEHDLPFNKVRCEFCPEMKGAIKRIKEDSNEHWGHMLCVNWIPNMYYIDNETKTDVKIEEYWKQGSCGRKSLTCEYCNVKYGDSVQCDDKRCRSAFHVTCAQQHGLICSWEVMAELKRKNDEEYYYPIYCKKHIKVDSKKMIDVSNQIEHMNIKRGSKISFLLDTPALVTQKKSYSENTMPKKDPRTRERQNFSTDIEKKVATNVIKRENNTDVKKELKARDLNDEIAKEAEDIQEIHEVVEAKLQKPDLAQGLQKPVRIRAKKSASFVTAPPELWNSSIIKNVNTEENPLIYYKFRADMANLLNFEDWADELGMKRVIQTFIKDQGLYDKETEKVVISRNEKLKQILGISDIPRAQIFSKLMQYMVKKSADKTDKKRKSSAGSEVYENDLGQLKLKKVKLNTDVEDSKVLKKCSTETPKNVTQISSPLQSLENKENGTMAIRKGNEIPSDKIAKTAAKNETPPKLAKRKSEHMVEEKKSSIQEAKLKKSTSNTSEKKKEHSKSMDTSDFMNSFSNFSHVAQTRKSSEINMYTNNSKKRLIYRNASSFMETFLGQEKESKQHKYEGLSSLINKPDQISFRKPMSWFTQTVSISEGEITFASDIIEKLWPKGAELLF